MKSPREPLDELRRRVLAWAVKLRVNPRVIRIQVMRRKWGSCSSAGTITLAADLVEKAEGFQDFVIVHELLHLRVPRHGRLFKALLSAHVPGWKEWERNCDPRLLRDKQITEILNETATPADIGCAAASVSHNEYANDRSIRNSAS